MTWRPGFCRVFGRYQHTRPRQGRTLWARGWLLSTVPGAVSSRVCVPTRPPALTTLNCAPVLQEGFGIDIGFHIGGVLILGLGALHWPRIQQWLIDGRDGLGVAGSGADGVGGTAGRLRPAGVPQRLMSRSPSTPSPLSLSTLPPRSGQPHDTKDARFMFHIPSGYVSIYFQSPTSPIPQLPRCRL